MIASLKFAILFTVLISHFESLAFLKATFAFSVKRSKINDSIMYFSKWLLIAFHRQDFANYFEIY